MPTPGLTPPPDDDDLDFTKPSVAPAPKPEVIAKARVEAAAGAPQLQEKGFYVALAHRSAARIPPRSGGKHTILVVEDDPDLAHLVMHIFTTAGFEMRWASNRDEINAELHREPLADLVLLDIVLPDADGLRILRRIRAHPRLAGLPVIMMTGKATPEDVLVGLAAGANGYVSKPFQMSGLVKAVNKVLGNA